MSKNKSYCITTSVTDLINDHELKKYLSENFSYTIPKLETYQTIKLASISNSLIGDIIENFIRIKFSLVDMILRDEILDDIQLSKQTYKNLNNKVISNYYRELNRHDTADKWIVYSDDDYDLVIDSLRINIQGHYLLNKSLVRKIKKHGEITVVEEKGYSFIKTSDYYGNIICLIEYFEEVYKTLLKDKNFIVFETMDVLKSFILFTHIAMRPQWLEVSKTKQNIGFYTTEDTFKISDLLKSIPDLNYTDRIEYHPKLLITFASGQFEGRLFATPDFIANHSILEVKCTSKISKKDYYQLLIYYALSQHKQNIDYYKNVISGELIYVKRRMKIMFNFKEVLNEYKLNELYQKIIDIIINNYKKSSGFRIINKYKKKR